MEDIVDIFKALNDVNRIRIMNLLSCQEVCVCEVEEILNISQSNASRHLNRLKTVKLIKGRKDAQWAYYSLNENTIAKYAFLRVFLEESYKNIEILREDQKKLILHREKETMGCKKK